MTRPKVGRGHFTQMPNAWLRDPKLSLRAKGLLTYMLSHADGYHLRVEQMVAESEDGLNSVRSALRVLVTAGYVVRSQVRNPDGTMGTYTYAVVDPTGTGSTGGGRNASGDDQGKHGTDAGRTGSNAAASGGSASKKKKVLEEEKKTIPPAPTSGSAAAVVDAQGEGDSPNGQTLEEIVNELARRRPDWSTRDIRTAVEKSLAEGRTLTDVAAAARVCYADPTTKQPGRLPYPGPWWPEHAATYGTIRAPDPPRHQQCRTHPGQWAHNCAGCHADAVAVDAADEPIRQSGADARAAARLAAQPKRLRPATSATDLAPTAQTWSSPDDATQ